MDENSNLDDPIGFGGREVIAMTLYPVTAGDEPLRVQWPKPVNHVLSNLFGLTGAWMVRSIQVKEDESGKLLYALTLRQTHVNGQKVNRETADQKVILGTWKGEYHTIDKYVIYVMEDDSN